MHPRSILGFSQAVWLAAVIVLVSCPAATIAQIDPSGDWRTWRTEHFRVHAQASLAAAAQDAAFEAERAYGLLATELHPPRGIVDLVVADNVDYSNGWATVFPSNRLSVYLAPPTGSLSLGNYDAWLRLVLLHELTHLFHLDRSKGVWSVLQAVFGRAPGLFPNMYQPSWVSEGIATYYESRFSAAGRAKGTFHRSLITAASEGGAWLDQGDVWLTSSGWPAGERPYAWGTEFLMLQAARFGDSIVPGLVERTSGQLWPFAVSHPLRSAGGEGVEEGWRRLRSRAEVDAARPAAERTVIERGLRVRPRPRVSPDGRWLAYVRNPGKTEAHVVVLSTDTWTEIDSRRVNGSADLTWVGNTLFVVQREFTSPVDFVGDLYRWNPGESWARVTHGRRLDHPFATHDGLVAAVDKGAGAERIVAVTSEGLGELPAPAGAYSRITGAPGGPLYAAARHHDGRWDIVLWNADAADQPRRITDDGALDTDPVWSEDGQVLLFASEREGVPQIYAYRVDDGEIVRVTAEPTGALEPAPIGSALAYSTLLRDGYALMMMPALPAGTTAGAVLEPVKLEAAAEVPLTEGGYDPWPALRPRYWVPFWHDEGQTGWFFSALSSGEDPIGRTFYLASAGVAFEPFRWEATLVSGRAL